MFANYYVALWLFALDFQFVIHNFMCVYNAKALEVDENENIST